MTQQQRTYPQGVTSWVDIEQRGRRRGAGVLRSGPGLDVPRGGAARGAVRYVIAQVDGLDVGRHRQRAPTAAAGRRTSRSTTSSAVLDAVTAAGGTVTTGPTVAGEGGTWAGSPTRRGGASGCGRPKRRLGAQIVNAPGAWNFSDLHADDPATAFYDAGVRVGVRRPRLRHDDPGARLRRPPRGHHRPGHPRAPGQRLGAARVRGRDRLGRSRRGGRAAALARDVRRRRPGRGPPRWPPSTAARCSPPRTPPWARTATIRDPQGAVFTGSQFTPPE